MTEVEFILSPRLQGHVDFRELIRPAGTFSFITYRSEIRPGWLFKIVSNGFHFEGGFLENAVYLERNKQRLSYSLQSIHKPSTKIQLFLIWETNFLRIYIVDAEWRETIKGKPQEQVIQEIGNRSKELSTPPTIPPNSLLRWARKQAILPSTSYQTYNDFYGTVVASLSAIDDQIQNMGLTSPFWDITYDGNKITSRNPKKETDIQQSLHALLYNISLAKNFEVEREPYVAGGKLDFLISGAISNNSIAQVCAEFKLAHSNDLVSGLTQQLPAYMKAKGCNFGIYVVFFFKGQYFSKPAEIENIGKLELFLALEKLQAGLDNIRAIVIDVSHKLPPSQQK